jgi:hypothetical protein
VAPLNALPPAAWEWILAPVNLGGLRLGLAVGLLLLTWAADRDAWVRLLGLPVAAAVIVQQALPRSFGHVNHAEIGILWLLLLLTAFSWADRFNQRRGPPLASPPLVVGAFLFCLSYSLVGLARVSFLGLDGWAGAMQAWAFRSSVSNPLAGPSLGLYAYQIPWFGEMLRWGLPFVTVCELLAPLALVCRPFRLVFLLGMLGFHVGVWLIMNISFWENGVLLLLLLIDWEKAAPWWRVARGRWIRGPGPV